MSEQERRWKLMYVPEQAMMAGIMASQQDGPDTVRVTTYVDLPDGFGVISVNYDPARRAFAVVVCHEMFPPLSIGRRMEVIGAERKMRVYDMKLIRQWAKEHPNEQA